MWPRTAAPFRFHLRKRKFRRETAQTRLLSLSDDPQDSPPPPPPQPLSGHTARIPGLRLWLRGKQGTKGVVPPLPKGARGGRADSPAERGSRDKKQDQLEVGGGLVPRKRGEGPAQRVRALSARMQHCDKAGPNAGLRTLGGKGLQRPGVSISISRFKSPSSVPPNPHLKVRGYEWTTSRPAQSAGEAKTRWRHRPTPYILPHCFPPRWHEKILHAIAAQVPPKKQKPSGEGTRTRVCAPRPPRAITYRLRPCRRTRTLADTR